MLDALAYKSNNNINNITMRVQTIVLFGIQMNRRYVRFTKGVYTCTAFSSCEFQQNCRLSRDGNTKFIFDDS